MDRLHGMKVFEKVADCGSFTAAAEACGMTPQNIAKIIAALEKDIGAQLLNRSTRRQNLTEIGEMYRNGPGSFWRTLKKLTPWSPISREK